MQTILDIIAPVFGLVGLGYLAARLGWFPAEATRGLSRFVFNFAVPALLFRTMATTRLPEVIYWEHLLSYYGGAYVAWILGALVSRHGFGRRGAEPAIAGMTAGFANTVLLGVPLVLTSLGERATLPLFLIIAFHSWQMFTVATLHVEIATGLGGGLAKVPRAVAVSLATNPIILALAGGIAVNLAGLGLPRAPDQLLEMLQRAALPCALFAMGASLAAYRVMGALPEAAVGSFLKLVVHPAAVWLLATHVFAIDPLWRDVAVLVAAVPVGVNVYVTAQQYQAGIAPAATAMLLSTAAATATIGVALWLLGIG
ncbi:MAG: AEC family transporter [Thalassobaculales bacterium]